MKFPLRHRRIELLEEFSPGRARFGVALLFFGELLGQLVGHLELDRLGLLPERRIGMRQQILELAPRIRRAAAQCVFESVDGRAQRLVALLTGFADQRLDVLCCRAPPSTAHPAGSAGLASFSAAIADWKSCFSIRSSAFSAAVRAIGRDRSSNCAYIGTNSSLRNLLNRRIRRFGERFQRA